MLARLRSDFPVCPESVEAHPQRAAVLVILFSKGRKMHVLMIKRARHLPTHAGEIAFPGGVVEAEDDSLLVTALRETEEEIGLDIADSSIIAQFPLVETLTGFEVTPYICLLEHLPKYRKNPKEVEEVFEMPLIPLLSTQAPDVGFKPSQEMVEFWFERHRIWGASAKILERFSSLHAI